MEVKVTSDCEERSALIDSAVVVQETDGPSSLKDLTVNVASQGSLQPEVSRPSHRSSRLLFTGVTVLVCAAVACAIVGVTVVGSPSAEATTTRSQHRRSTEQVELVRLSADKARETGAYCLDGTVPAYYFMRGFSGGEDKWRVVLEGGGYCESLAQCYAHSFTEFGTSRVLRPVPAGLGGFLSNNPDSNPEFYNWNTVFVHYCDGSSFTGNRPEPVTYRGKTLYFRGSRILDAILNDLLENRGLRNAERVILAGNSAGGMAVFRHADHVRSMLPSRVQFAALPGSALFVWDPRQIQRAIIRHATVHGMLDGPDFPACTRAYPQGERWKCLLPQFAVTQVQSPMFVLHSAYDAWVLRNILRIECSTQSCFNPVFTQALSRRSKLMSSS
ncbi:NOTUM [Branchiostoma lanceolatum]|uniref:NOTUM protein n=1 Tax=Branchiostoma lanceolatum TaxID=7740 RepID=A0A8J9YUS9_BRALA|nr:NOTUM [Branchiostoma lanceolatum]